MAYKPVGADENGKFPPRVQSVMDDSYAPSTGSPEYAAQAPAEATKLAGDTILASDAAKTQTWNESAAFTIRMPDPAGFAIGQETDIVTLGSGVASFEPHATNYYPFPATNDFAGGIWAGRTATVSVVSESGRSAILATATGASTSGGFGHANDSGVVALRLANMGLKPGDSIVVSAHLTPPSGVNGRFQVRFYKSGTLVSERTETGSPGAGVRTLATQTIPATADSLTIVTYSTATAAGDLFTIRDIRIRKTSETFTGHFDGSSPGAYWLGTPNASPSSMGLLLGTKQLAGQGRARLRYLGSSKWIVSPLGTAPDVLTSSTQLYVDRDNGQAGITAPTGPLMGFSDTASTSGRLYGARFQPSRDMLIKSATFRVTAAATTNDPVEVVILDSTGARIATSGSVSSLMNATGTKVIALPSVPLVKGQTYYACLVTTTTGTAASLRRVTVFGDAYGTGFPLAEAWYSAQTIPVGATVTGLTSTDSVPILVLREFS